MKTPSEIESDSNATMRRTAHTPGPWSYCGADRGGCSCMQIGSDDGPIATVVSGKWGDDYPAIRLTSDNSLEAKAEAYMEQITYGEVSEDCAKANARLIAAAPDLYELALKVSNLNADAGEIGAGMLVQLVTMANAAIARAKGDAL